MKDLIQGFKEGMTGGLEKIASEVPAEDHAEFIEKCAEEFERLIVLTGMEKEASAFAPGGAAANTFRAGFAGKMPGAYAAAGGIAAGAVGGLAATALQGLASAAVKKVSGHYGDKSSRTAYDQAYRRALSQSEMLRESEDQVKLKRMADSIYSFAPTVASDPNVLANILVNAMYGDTLDLQTVRAVTELEEKLNKMKD